VVCEERGLKEVLEIAKVLNTFVVEGWNERFLGEVGIAPLGMKK